jgi:hypothetical protein
MLMMVVVVLVVVGADGVGGASDNGEGNCDVF